MAKTRVFVKWVVAVLLIALVGGARAVSVCNIDTKQLNPCMPAVTGESPPQPSKKCCKVISKANLPCLCSYKNVLPAVGINPKNALALPKKCGLETPPECKVH
ncbi:putative lipid-transfer protein DIR1 [Mangifera indica]|uniref:putative lipid-transfer protein DIR1 n=1 Tax=Mangifera indica TaxID=29780 RepID=UPI001CFB370A|nr:putative lipid-transfer protein DIR1 [Mangifera indica]